MKILVVDDEPLARSKIIRFLKEIDLKFIIVEANNGIVALELIKKEPPDLILLDIEMPGMSGLQLLQNLENRNLKIIFQTAFEHYAVKAFEENACDYLLKPFTKERLEQALQKALSRIELEKLEKSFHQKNCYLEKIAISTTKKTLLLDVHTIVCIKSMDHYSTVITEAGEFLCDLSLTFLEKRLDPKMFARVHRKNIVKLDHIVSILKGENMKIELTNGMQVEVSRQNRNKVQHLT